MNATPRPGSADRHSVCEGAAHSWCSIRACLFHPEELAGQRRWGEAAAEKKLGEERNRGRGGSGGGRVYRRRSVSAPRRRESRRERKVRRGEGEGRLAEAAACRAGDTGAQRAGVPTQQLGGVGCTGSGPRGRIAGHAGGAQQVLCACPGEHPGNNTEGEARRATGDRTGGGEEEAARGHKGGVDCLAHSRHSGITCFFSPRKSGMSSRKEKSEMKAQGEPRGRGGMRKRSAHSR